MDDLLGYTAIAVVSLITLLLALRWPAISKILYTALAIRIFAMLLGHYVITLPDSTADANTFESLAWTHSLMDINLIDHQSFSSLLKYYEGPSAQFISFFLRYFLLFFRPKYTFTTVYKFTFWNRLYFFRMEACNHTLG